MKVLVIGGGIAGLVTALTLHREGFGCTVFEQRTQNPRCDAGICLAPDAVGVLARLGLLDELVRAGLVLSELRRTDRHGQATVREPLGIHAGHTMPHVAVHHDQLHRLLREAVEEQMGDEAVRFGNRLDSWSQYARGVVARFAEPSDAGATATRGDVLVAADGADSTVRTELHPDQGAPRGSGATMWCGTTSWPRFASGRTMVIAGDDAARAVVWPLAAGNEPGTMHTSWTVTVQTGGIGTPRTHGPAGASREDARDLEACGRALTSASLDVHGLVLGTADWTELQLRDHGPLSELSRGRLALVGDAAHPEGTPCGGGAGRAILDADSLVTHLSSGRRVVDALRAYSRDRQAAMARDTERLGAGG